MRLFLLRFLATILLGVLWLGGTAAAQTPEAQLVASGGAAADGFGGTVAFSADGTVVLVEADTDEVNGTNRQGSASVYGALLADETITIEVTESIGVSDSVQVTPPAQITVTESIGVSDSPQVTPPVQISVTESIGVADSVDVMPPATITVTENIGVADSVGVQLPVQITVTERIGVSDSVYVQLPVVIAVTEAIGVVDQVDPTATVLGDVTGDGDAKAFDAATILRHAVGLIVLEGSKLWAADVSGQADVTPLDASLVLQFFVGQIGCLPATPGCEAAGKRPGGLVAGELAWGAPRFTDGDVVELPLVLDGAEGVTALDVRVDFDPAAFDVLSVASGLEGDGTVVHRADGDELRLAAASAGALKGEVAVVRLRRKQDDRRVALEGTWTPNEGTEQVLRAAPVPERYALAENYPNPFNPATTIRYALPEAADVRLTVINELGQEVAVLVDERRPAGQYEVTFDAGDLASGVYFYRIEAGGFTQTLEMVLVK